MIPVRMEAERFATGDFHDPATIHGKRARAHRR